MLYPGSWTPGLWSGHLLARHWSGPLACDDFLALLTQHWHHLLTGCHLHFLVNVIDIVQFLIVFILRWRFCCPDCLCFFLGSFDMLHLSGILLGPLFMLLQLLHLGQSLSILLVHSPQLIQFLESFLLLPLAIGLLAFLLSVPVLLSGMVFLYCDRLLFHRCLLSNPLHFVNGPGLMECTCLGKHPHPGSGCTSFSPNSLTPYAPGRKGCSL